MVIVINSDFEYNFYFFIVIKYYLGFCSISNENYLVLSFWVIFDKLVKNIVGK